MNYYLYIDESGSLNGKDINDSIFSVSACVIKEENKLFIKDWVKLNIEKIKKELLLDSHKELKSHVLIKANKRELLESFASDIRSNLLIDYCAYIKNKGINKKWLENKNITYNFMIKQIIKELIKKIKFSSKKDNLIIIADERELSIGSLNSLEEYLKTSFLLEKKIFKSLSCTFKDSSKHWGVQMADFISYLNYHEIRENIHDLNKRKIY